MITLKQWKEFKNWRLKRLLTWMRSPEYKEIQEARANITSPTIHKFLWWEEKVYPSSSWMLMEKLRIQLLEMYKKPWIPDETVEGCLDYLSSKKDLAKR